MERETWERLRRRLRSLRDRRPPRAQFTNHSIVETFLWAAFNDRPVCWACEPRKRRQVARLRVAIERGFGWLAGVGGDALPPWVRTLPRVRRWLLAKVAILVARRDR